MLVVGLTGGIASGKSAAAAAFAHLGIPVSDADVISRELTAPGKPGFTKLIEVLGRDALDPSGRLDRGRLRRRLFSDAGCRASVETILHPLILERMQADLEHGDTPYAIAAIPLLTESAPARALVGRVLVVDCPESLQIERLMARDGETEASARAILATQSDRERRRAAGDDILFNTGSLTELERAVTRLHAWYLDIARSGPTPSRAGVTATAHLDGKLF